MKAMNQDRAAEPKAASVLFVDDDLGILNALMRRMHKEPFELRTATSGEEALGIMARSRIDLVVSDMNMPGMSGMEFLAGVAREHPDCVRIMLTGRPTLDVAISAINSGHVSRFLTKPYDAGELASVIREVLAQRRSLLESSKGQSRRRPDHSGKRLASEVADDVDAEGLLRTHFSSGDEAAGSTADVEQLNTLPKDFLARFEKPGYRALIQHYEVQEVIGRGSMGVVLKAHDTTLARDVALKLLTPACAGNQVSRQRFAQEARYAAGIRHSNVVTIFAVSSVGDTPFLVMEYVYGCSLQDRLDAGQRFTVREVVEIGRQTALGLAAAHELRLVHRDIKPANILIEGGTQCVRITDFGLARALDNDACLSQQGMLIGTPLFMSPEQVNGKPVTPATDLFSLGSVLYTLCTGTRPFPAPTMSSLLLAIAEGTPPPIRTLNPEIPEWLAEVIQKLHAKNPTERFPSAAALANTLLRNAAKMTCGPRIAGVAAIS